VRRTRSFFLFPKTVWACTWAWAAGRGSCWYCAGKYYNNNNIILFAAAWVEFWPT